MNIDAHPTTTGVHQAAPPPPRWAKATAHAAVLVTLPAGLWRITMGLGIPVGYSPDVLRSLYDVPGWGTLGNIAISLFQESLALLTLGLVKQWGEVIPRWLPFIGGKRVRPGAAVVAAGLGAVALTLLMFSQLAIWGQVDHGPLSDVGRKVMGFCYLPMVLWGPLLGVVTVSYYLRHRHLRR